MPNSSNGHKATDLSRAAIYRRVSSEVQGKRVSPEEQLADCEAYAQGRGYTVVAVYSDIERYRSAGRLVEPSGTRTDRPDFQRLLADARDGKLDVVIAWKEDRLYRGVKPAVLVGDLLEETPVTVELVKETFDRKMLFIKSAIGKLEIESIRERTEMGMKARMRKGLIHGGPVPAGYVGVKGDDGQTCGYVLDPAWRGFFDDLARLYITRLPLAEIGRRLSPDPRTGRPWLDSTLSYILRNPFYRGQIAYGWQNGKPEFIVPGRHAPAWDAETCAAVERELARRGGRHNGPRSRALLSGILRCGLCGQTMACGTTHVPARNGQRRYAYRYYGCARPVMVRDGRWHGRRTHAANYINETKCLRLIQGLLAGLDASQIDGWLTQLAMALGGPTPDDGTRRARLEAEAETLRARLADLAVGLDGVRNASPAATETILSAITTTGKQLDQVRAELDELGRRQSAAPDLAQARDAIMRLVGELEVWDEPATLQPLLQTAFPALYVAGGQFVSPVPVWEN
ncbi:MAG: recombinase family protein [Anaerolineales bacterium]|nr:recombinase family protein [Anaerolineales bacterium]